ncbi:PREDICTED: putative MOB kinase activator-like 2B [Camelina sativa]|uniref:MOB kinase activator-like 2B n=1 Tax=Camelina sativa TaxID=90675 RepID=A0ABM0TCI4_CAMSA|nr:PREDICTED: putative MOB kinase activator-like 2B [Camelina sativa]
MKRKKPFESQLIRDRELLTVTIVCDNFREAVKLPLGVDINEWLALNIVAFYKQMRRLYATLEEFCTLTTCPDMKAGRYEYRWVDERTGKRHKMGSSPKYIESVLNWIRTQIYNETIFPKIFGEPFPPNFVDVVKCISRKLFRVYAHIYHSHFRTIVSLKGEAHLNTCFKHFVLFISEYQLVTNKKELAPLQKLINIILEA